MSHSQQNVACICGCDLTRICGVSLIYDGKGCTCDICGRKGESDDIVWHCPQEFNLAHPDGYDICNNCCVTQSKQTTTTHTTNNPVIAPLTCKQQIYCQQDEKCQILQQFINLMKQYNKNHVAFVKNMDNTKLLDIVDCYLHLMYQHDKDEEFEAILVKLGCCDMTQCTFFMQNNRNRMIINNDYDEVDNKCDITCCIMNKMHCYFQHSYDIGHRLSIKEKIQINNKISELKHDDDDDDLFNEHALNIKIKQINKLIHAKREEHKTIYSKFNNKMRNKYNQLLADNEQKQNDNKMYSFGYEFRYGYDGELGSLNLMNSIPVSPKYASFKEELICNTFATLNIHQYNNEYSKAMIHFNSLYCKQQDEFKSYEQEYDIKTLKYVQRIFLMEYLLSLMIYCNYTKLQYEFCATYRQNNGGIVNTFYHGTNQQFYLPCYTSMGVKSGIDIQSPFSTSSSFEVAAYFATNVGLIIQLGDHPDGDSLFSARYFSVSWISDFAHEREYLFVQTLSQLMINNIIDANSGYEYEMILQSNILIHDLITGVCDDNNINTDGSICALADALLEDQLSRKDKLAKYRSLKTLTKFGKQIAATVFLQQDIIEIHYWKLKKYGFFLSKYLLYSEYEWVNLQMLDILFPNVKQIIVSKINLSPLVIDNIMAYFSNFTTEVTEPNKILKIAIISPKSSSTLSIKDAIDKYSSMFRKIDVFIYLDMTSKEFVIQQCDDLEFVVKAIGQMNGLYFQDKNNAIALLMEKLIQHRLNDSNNAYVNNDGAQMLFNRWCDRLDFVQITWAHLASNKKSYLFKLISHPTVDKWIKIGQITQLFPNIGIVAVIGIHLSSFVIDDIFRLLTSGKSRLYEFIITDPIEEELSIDEVMVDYVQTFEDKNWSMGAEEYSNPKKGKYLYFQMRG